MLKRQDERVRLLLLRTSVLGRVNRELADLLSGGGGLHALALVNYTPGWTVPAR